MKKHFRLTSFFKYCALGLIILVFSGCSHDDEDPGAQGSYYIRFRVNGLQKEYKMHTVAQFYYDEANLSYHCNMVGSLKINNTTDAFNLFLINKEEYKSGIEYQLKNEIEMPKTGAIMPQVMAVFFDESGKAYTAQFLPADWYEFNDEATVKFTTVADKYVKGTFSARMFTSMPEREELLITDGEFYFSIF